MVCMYSGILSKVLATLLLGSAIALGSELALVKETGRPAYELVSVPDKGTVLNQKDAERSRRAAEYILNTDPANPGISDYTVVVDDDSQRAVEVRWADDNWVYTFAAADAKGDSPEPDSLYFWIESAVRGSSDAVVTGSDNGLDGRCNFVIVPDELKGEFRMSCSDIIAEILEFYEKK